MTHTVLHAGDDDESQAAAEVVDQFGGASDRNRDSVLVSVVFKRGCRHKLEQEAENGREVSATAKPPLRLTVIEATNLSGWRGF